MVKVSELIKELQSVDPDRIVIMSRDGEGNDYSPLASTWEGAYLAKSTYHGKAGLERLTDEFVKAGYSDEDIVNGNPAIILQPTY